MERKDVTISVFDEEDYSMWKKRITMFLRLKECDTAITRGKTNTDSTNWDKNDLKAIDIIYSAISKSN